MLNIVLEPEIPSELRAIVACTCAATGVVRIRSGRWALTSPERAVRRAGLDYWHLVEVFDYENLMTFLKSIREAAQDCWLTTTKPPVLSGSPVLRIAGSSSAKRPPDFPLISESVSGTAASVCP